MCLGHSQKGTHVFKVTHPIAFQFVLLWGTHHTGGLTVDAYIYIYVYAYLFLLFLFYMRVVFARRPFGGRAFLLTAIWWTAIWWTAIWWTGISADGCFGRRFGGWPFGGPSLGTYSPGCRGTHRNNPLTDLRYIRRPLGSTRACAKCPRSWLNHTMENNFGSWKAHVVVFWIQHRVWN